MRDASRCTLVAAILACGASPGWAQSVLPGPPGPYVFDLRGTTLGVPQAAGFYPDVPSDVLVPARGFGIEAGGHVYFGRLGPARIGGGASLSQVRGTSGPLVAITARILAPQLSFNFGTSRGWSYLSGGVGLAHMRGGWRADETSPDESRGSGAFGAMNVGAGARWFITSRVAFTFDLRLHRINAREATREVPGTPAAALFAASAGLSFK